jgi:hypothetical protein
LLIIDAVTPKPNPKKSKKNGEKDIKRRGNKMKKDPDNNNTTVSGNSRRTASNRPAPNTGFEVRRISFRVAASLVKLEPREDLDTLLQDNRLRVVLRIIPTEREHHINVKCNGSIIGVREVHTLVPVIK